MFDLLALVSQLEGQHVPSVLFVSVPATVLARDASLAASILRLGIVLAHPVVALGRLDADVLLDELLRGKVVHEVLGCHEATLLVCILQQDLVQSLDDRLHDLLKAELHRPIFLLERTNVLAKLLVDLANDPVQPVFHVCVCELDLLAHLDRLVVELLRRLDLNVQLVNLRVGRATTLNLNIGLLVLHLELVELLGDLLVLVPQHVQLLLVVAHGLQQLRVGCFPREKLLDDLLDIGEACLRSDLLEGLLYLSRPCHFLVHLRLEESAPEFLRQEVLIHLQLIRVFIVIGCLVSDLLLPGIALDSPFQRGLLVVEGLEHRCKPVLPLEVVLVNQAHKLLKTMLSLELLLFGLAVTLGFLHVDGVLVLVAILCLIEANLDGDQVCVHPVDHVLSLAFDHLGLVVLVLDGLKPVEG